MNKRIKLILFYNYFDFHVHLFGGERLNEPNEMELKQIKNLYKWVSRACMRPQIYNNKYQMLFFLLKYIWSGVAVDFLKDPCIKHNFFFYRYLIYVTFVVSEVLGERNCLESGRRHRHRRMRGEGIGFGLRGDRLFE